MAAKQSFTVTPPPLYGLQAYRLGQRLRRFVEEARLRYDHSLCHIRATDDLQYARKRSGEIKLPDIRLHPTVLK